MSAVGRSVDEDDVVDDDDEEADEQIEEGVIGLGEDEGDFGLREALGGGVDSQV